MATLFSTMPPALKLTSCSGEEPSYKVGSFVHLLIPCTKGA